MIIRVSGAGTAACNGDYPENGTNGGKPAYEKVGGGMWIYWPTAPALGYWLIGSSKDAPLGARYYKDGVGATPDEGEWELANAGAEPAPTVTVVIWILTINSHDGLTPSIAFDPSPDNTADATPTDCDFTLEYDDGTHVIVTSVPLLVVSGAGHAACNGNYVHNGKYAPTEAFACEKEGGGFWMWGAVGGYFVLSVNKGDAEADWYYRGGLNHSLPANPWTTAAQGTDSPPTVVSPDPTDWVWDGWYVGGARMTEADRKGDGYDFSLTADKTVVATYTAESAVKHFAARKV